MGQVYRARDSRLQRDVAVKVLHRSMALTPEHADRLGREARAAGSLNHPNIIAVFDVGSDGRMPYIVTELLEGESLRTRLGRGALPYRKAIEYGIELAEALGAAHEKGIWHRDVKPGNVFITTDGRVKLLDFGLVKLKPRDAPVGDEDSTSVVTAGGVHGTHGYMSPEQILGETLDHRVDIFALGAVLFELLAGAPAFRRKTAMETTKAVLNEEPADLLAGRAKVPPAAVAVVRRCLEKNREERFQSARDLAFHLQQLHDIEIAANPAEAAPRSPWRPAIWAALGAGVVALAAGLLAAALRPAVPVFEQLTFRRVRIGGARYASQDGAVVYSESRDGRPPDVWWLSGGDSQPRDLGRAGADVFAAHGGKLALSVRGRFTIGDRFVGTLAEAPMGEGLPHELAENVDDADWDPSGSKLAIVKWATGSVGGDSRLEYPPGTVLYSTPGSLRYPRFSRDGQRIAFLVDPTGRAAGGKVAMVDLAGHFTALTDDWPSAHGVAWSARGEEVWFAAGPSRADRSLRAVDLRGRQRVVLPAPVSMTLRDIASDGSVLLSRDEERSAILGVPPGETTERDLSWFDTSGLADVSDDGRLMLFSDRFGVYLRHTDGSAPILLGLKDGFADDISVDGTKVLATTAMGDRLVVLPAGLGDPVPLPADDIKSYRGALWLPDGQRVLFNGLQPGKSLRSFVQDLGGARPRALTSENTWATSISPDGQTAACIGPEGISLWPVEGGPPRALASSRPGERPVAWSGDGRSVWVFRRAEVPASVFELDVATGARRPWKKLQPPDPSGVYSIDNFKVTPDGRAYFYSYRRVLSQLYAVKGLK
jgi:hypothetical protein